MDNATCFTKNCSWCGFSFNYLSAYANMQGKLTFNAAVQCGKLLPPLHGFEVPGVSFNSTDYGAIKVFQCQPGYTLKGSLMRSCIFSGQWSGVRTYCQGE